MKKFLIIISNADGYKWYGEPDLHIVDAKSLEDAFDKLSMEGPRWRLMIDEAIHKNPNTVPDKVMHGTTIRAFDISSEIENANNYFNIWEKKLIKYLTSPKGKAATVADAIFDEMNKFGERAKSYLSGPEAIKDATHFMVEAKKLGASLKKTHKETKLKLTKLMKNLDETTKRLLEGAGLKTPISKD